MRQSKSLRDRLAGGVAAAVLAVSAFCATPALAGTPPVGGLQVNYVAREQPIGQFLQQFFGDLNLPVTVSPNVRGTINGPFAGRADRVYGDIARAFDLATYYDGVSVYVYPSSDISTRVLPVGSGTAARVRRTVGQLKLQDAQNKLQTGTDNVLLVTGTRRFIQQVEELARAHGVSEVMSPAVEYRVFYLRYAWAEDITLNMSGREVVIPGVASILRSLLTREKPGAEVIARRERSRPPTVQGLRGQGLARTASRQGTLGLTPVDTGDDEGDAEFEAAALSAGGGGALFPEVAMMGAADTVRVQGDSRLNAVIVRDAGDRMATYENLIRALDVEPTLLEIEATIIDVNTDRLRELGINFRFDDGEGGVLFGNGTVDDLRLGRGGGDSRSITPTARGLAISTVIGNADSFTSRIRALEAKGAARIVSRPQVMTLSNVEAVFDSSRTFFVRVEGEREVDLFNVSAGTSLRVTPHVSRDSAQTRIRMLVNIEDGSLTDAEVDDIPVVERSTINTQALIAEGQSLLVGGLTVDADSDRTDQVPVLGDIPGVGRLFKTTRRSKSRVERMFLITPRLAPMMSGPALPPAPRYESPAPFSTEPTPKAPASTPSSRRSAAPQVAQLPEPTKVSETLGLPRAETPTETRTYAPVVRTRTKAVEAEPVKVVAKAAVAAPEPAAAPAAAPSMVAEAAPAPAAKPKRRGLFGRRTKPEPAAPAAPAPAPEPPPPFVALTMAPIPDPAEASPAPKRRGPRS